MTHETPADLPDLAGVMAEVVRLEVVAVSLDARLDASLGARPEPVGTPRPGGGAVIDLREQAPV